MIEKCYLRHSIFLLVFVLLTPQVSAQEKIPAFYINGSAGFSINNKSNINTQGITSASNGWSMNLSPEFGYYLNERISLGTRIGYETSKYRDYLSSFSYLRDAVIVSREASLALFGKYHWNLSDKLLFATSIGCELGVYSTEVVSINDSETSNLESFFNSGILFLLLFSSRKCNTI